MVPTACQVTQLVGWVRMQTNAELPGRWTFVVGRVYRWKAGAQSLSYIGLWCPRPLANGHPKLDNSAFHPKVKTMHKVWLWVDKWVLKGGENKK